MRPRSYTTRQTQALLRYLQAQTGRHLTAGEIVHHFAEGDTVMSTATVYRQLERLCKDGVVASYRVDGASATCYAFVGEHAQEEDAIHCKCTVCGQLIHLDCKQLTELQKHLTVEHGFQLDRNHTVLCGLCQNCLRQKDHAE